MFIGQGLSLEARRATQAERRSANTTTAPASAAAVAAAASTAAAAATEQKNVRTLFPPKNREKIHISINNVDYFLLTPSVSMFFEGSSLEARHAAHCSGREAVSQYRYSARICGGCSGGRAGFIRVSAILRSLPTRRNGFHCLSTKPCVRRWTDPCHRR